MGRAASPDGSFELESTALGALPIVDHFFSRLGLMEALEAHVPNDDSRLLISPAVVLGVVVPNLVVDHEPAYGISDWAGSHEPSLLGLGTGEAGLLNDDRVGRSLERLFDADRATLLTEVVLKAVRSFCHRLLPAAQRLDDGHLFRLLSRGRRPDPGRQGDGAICFGHNKDHRPDLKQLRLDS